MTKSIYICRFSAACLILVFTGLLFASTSDATAATGSPWLPVCAPPDTICPGDTLQLNGTQPLATNYSWTPNYNISSTNSPTPKVYPLVTTSYIVNATGLTSNLITNGDFSQGNVAFTSAYTYTTNLWPEATYYVGTNPQLYHSNFSPCPDHTTGNGNMMIVNGAGTPNTIIWQQVVPVVPATTYQFHCWLTSVHSSSPAQLQFFVNNLQIGPVFTASPTTCSWNMFFDQWYSGASTSATISIRNQNTSLSGNDFAIDDIWFAQVIAIKDTHVVVVENPHVNIGSDTLLCKGESLTLTAIADSTAVNYIWYLNGVPTGTPLSTTTYNINTNNMATGQHIVAIETNNGSTSIPCPGTDSVIINIVELPKPDLGPDTVFCEPNTITLDAGPGHIYLWSHGATTQTTTITQSGYYLVYVDGGNGTRCNGSASIHVEIVKIPLVDLGPDTCSSIGVPISSGVDQASYTWNTGDATKEITPAQSGVYTVTVTYYPGSGCEASDSKVFNIINIDLGKDTTICSHETLTLAAPLAPVGHSYNYYWLPDGQTTPTIVISDKSEGDYYITLDAGGGCTGEIKVSVIPCEIIIPNVFTPNSDGYNDYFAIDGIDNFPESKMLIYNRWGQRVFESDNYNSSSYWDARDQADGVYYYVLYVRQRIQGKMEVKQYSGSVTVLRGR
jgi:gliding motility-associated-like protein